MTHYQKPPELYDGLRLHQNENTGGCSPRVLDALRALRVDQIGFYPPYSETVEACARYLGVSAGTVALTNGLDEGHHGDRGRVPPAVVRRADPGGHRPGAGVRDFQVRHRGGRRTSRAGHAPPRLQLSARRRACGDHAPDPRRVPHQPEQPDRGVDAARRDPDDCRGACRPRRSCSWTRRTRSFPARRSFRDLPSFPNVIVGRTFSKAFGLAGLRIGCLVGAPETSRSDSARDSGVQREHRRRRRGAAALEDRTFVDDYLRQVAESKALLYAACDRLGLKYWKSARISCWSRVGERLDALVQGAADRGIYLRDRSTEPGCAGCVRIAHRCRRTHAPVHRGDGRGAMRRGGDRSPDDRDPDRAVDLARRQGHATRCGPASGFSTTCWSSSRVTARSTSASRRTGDLDVDQHHTVEDLGIALGEAVSKALGDRRGINRAGYFVMPMDETLAVAAIDLGGRPHAVVDLKVRVARVGDLQTELVHDFFEGFAIGARANVHVKVLYGRSSHHHDRSGVQGVRPRAPRRLRDGSPARAHAPEHEGAAVIALIDYQAGNLTSVKKAFAAARRRPLRARRGRRSRPRRDAIVVPGVGHFAATRALDRGVDRRDPGARRRRAGRCSASVSACSGSSKAARRRRTVPGLGSARPAGAIACLTESNGTSVKIPARRVERARRRPTRFDRRRRRRPARRSTSRTASSRRSRPTRSRSPSTARDSRRSFSGAGWRACSSIRRSRARSACDSPELPAAWLRHWDSCYPSASSPASMSATVRSSKA